MLKIALASDHAGFKLKEILKENLLKQGYIVEDFGTDSEEICDYPDFIKLAALSIKNSDCNLGVVFGGSGNGEAIAANKIKGIRCGVCWNVKSARLAKEHNNANMIAIGARFVTKKTAIKIVDNWLKAEFQKGRHLRRINKIE